MSLFRTKGGKTSAVRMPSEAEGFALAVASAMQWAHLRSSMNRMFFVDIAAECKRLKCTPSEWSNAEMTFFVQQKVFNSIPQEGLEMYFTRKFTYEKAERRAELFREFVESVMYKYLATVGAGRDYVAAVELAREAKLEKVLQSEALGGKAEWSLADFLDETVWHECCGQTGLKEISKKFLTLIVAGGQKAKPVNPVCTVCGELKCAAQVDPQG